MVPPEENGASWVSDLREMIAESTRLLKDISENKTDPSVIKDWMIQSDESLFNSHINVFRKTIDEISFIKSNMMPPK